jgi:hypothetical protein
MTLSERLRQVRLWRYGKRDIGTGIFLSFRRINDNQIRLVHYLDRALYPGAVYLDLFDPSLRKQFDPFLRHAAVLSLQTSASTRIPNGPPYAAVPTPAQDLLEKRKLPKAKAALSRRIARTQFVLVMLDRGFQRDFINAGHAERIDSSCVDWVRFELETADRLGKDVFIVYNHSQYTLANPTVYNELANEYQEFIPILLRLLRCEWALVEFGTKQESDQLQELSTRLKNRCLNAWRATALDAQRQGRRRLVLAAALFLLFAAVLLFTFFAGRSGTLQDWFRWRVGYPSGDSLSLQEPMFAQKFFGDELELYNDVDRLANLWKLTLVTGYEQEESKKKRLVAIRSDTFEKDYETFCVLTTLREHYRIVSGVAFLVAPGPTRSTQKYRQLPAKFDTQGGATSSPGSLVTLPKPNRGEYLLLLLLCEVSQGNFDSIPSKFIKSEVQP